METQISGVTGKETTSVKISTLPANRVSSPLPLWRWDDLGTLGKTHTANTWTTEQISYPYLYQSPLHFLFNLNLKHRRGGGEGLFLVSFYVFINFNYTYLWGIYSTIMNAYSVVKIASISLTMKSEISL